jgi:hypothetical protein
MIGRLKEIGINFGHYLSLLRLSILCGGMGGIVSLIDKDYYVRELIVSLTV